MANIKKTSILLQVLLLFNCVFQSCQWNRGSFKDFKPDTENNEEQSTTMDFIKGALPIAAGVVGGAAAVAATPVVLGAAGFTAAGVAAGSVAAAVQAQLGVIGAGSAFAGLQSIGAAGLGALGSTVVGGIGSFFGYKAAKDVTDTDDDKRND